MSTALHAAYALPCDVEAAYAVLSGEGWPAAKDAALHDGSRLESREETDDGGVVLRSTRGMPSGIPGFLEKILPADGRAGQTDTWAAAQADGSRTGTWRADVPGAPVDVHGTMRLVPTATGCDYVIEGTAKVKIPLIGGKAEKFVADATARTTAGEADVLRSLVTG
ncbi:MAG: DUF2505 domain-containing protein [Frankiales bacterium]|nr:MAG: DUF2505 domain-containing protein [Frankiales bacterium]